MEYIAPPQQGVKRPSGGSQPGKAKRQRVSGFNGGAREMQQSAQPQMGAADLQGMQDALPTGTQLDGAIKSYSTVKGFGFITTDHLPGKDVYFKGQQLPEHLRKTEG